MKKLLIIAIAPLAILACGAEEPVETEPITPQGQQQPMQGHPGSMMASESTSLDYQLPDEWQQSQPSSPMRLDQATIPGEGGEGELAVFFFGPGGGGSVEANLQRWVDQMSTSDEPERESFEVDGLTVTWIDVSGTINPSATGMGPAEPQPNSRMFAAVVEGEGGPWFFKATGPEETMDDARDEFVNML
ncbi:MAG: hypothetical protein R3338_12950, partial [Thermoanaerobaculia bacterium]|nr:hypothetical protein [Thermoanaerobaculia bacterium]